MSGLVKVFEEIFYPTKFKDDEGADRSREKVDPAQFEAQVISLYSTLFKVIRKDFELWGWTDTYRGELELLADVDHTSGELTKLKGWLQTVNKDKVSYFSDIYSAEISLNPIKTKSGLIHMFEGTIEWTPLYEALHKGGPRPVICIPVYGIPSGKIIDLKASSFNDSRSLFGADGGMVKIEYQSFDFKTAR